MVFAEFAQMLYPYCGDGKYPSDLVVTLVGNIIEEADDESCSLLDKKPDYLTRIYNGTKPFPKKDATFVFGHLDKVSFEAYISDLSDDAIDGLLVELSKRSITITSKYEVAAKCADVFQEILSVCAKGTRHQVTNRAIAEDPFETLKIIDDLLASLPVPEQISPPDQHQIDEQVYLSELFAAYGDKEGILDFGEANLVQFDEYNEDMKDRRIDYFAAESVRRGVSELYSGRFSNQFEILKDETLAGVKNTARRTYPNGYECLLSVMEQATAIQVQRYILSKSPNWISNRIKMGVCHFLVNERKLKWVKR